MDWVTGLNVYTDLFNEFPKDGAIKRDYEQYTIGGFVQNTWQAGNWLALETGVRIDHVVDMGTVFLPRIAALFKITPQLTSRLGGGLGYKTPTMFTEETERIQYRSVESPATLPSVFERSY